jgi:hypothetical protein
VQGKMGVKRKKKTDFMRPGSFELSSQMKGNSIHDSDFFKTQKIRQVHPL